MINIDKSTIKVILDTDTFNECDDQFALAYMLKSQDVFNVKAITVAPYSHKSCDIKTGLIYSYNEILKISRYLGKDLTDITYIGSDKYLGDDCYIKSTAANKIIELALVNEKIIIMAIGALTNVASAINLEPKIKDKIEVVWLGGHSLLQDNNAEFNFIQDIKAVRTVFDSKVKLTVVPCKNVASNLTTSIFELSHHLKDKSELCNYLLEKFYDDGYHGIMERRPIWDISVVAYLINKDWFKTIEISCPNINDDSSYGKTSNRPSIAMAVDIDSNSIYEDLFRKLAEEGK